MISSSFFILFLILVSHFVFSETDSDEISSVITLTKENFDELVLQSEDRWFIKFYAEWCGHCKALKPIFESVAAQLGDEIKFGEVNCEKQSKICNTYNVQGYPTLKFFIEDQIFEYHSHRTEENLISFCEKFSGPAVISIKDFNSLNEKLTEEKTNFVLLTSSSKNEANREIDLFSKIATRNLIYSDFYILESENPLDPDLYSKFAQKKKLKSKLEKINQFPVVIAFIDSKKIITFQFESNDYESADDFFKFVQENTLPLLPQLSADSFALIDSAQKTVGLAIVDPSDDKTEDYLKMIKKVAFKRRSEFAFCWIDGIQWESFLNHFQIKVEELPMFFVMEFRKEIYFKDPNLISSVENINDFLDSILDGSIKPQGRGSSFISRILGTNNPNTILKIVFFGAVGIILYFYFVSKKEKRNQVDDKKEDDKKEDNKKEDNKKEDNKKDDKKEEDKKEK
ncbi:protein disulfide-isomerase tmx3 [Anaeramoeba ignava]|uniref:Protein disulfide-isomerase tmx3 n=1 Tax=Anaeramoeba ignava TaxID=1746090 RepID=A0A9Q0LUQ0_ANAIG|nr:protein disulfide-isomerase tmx3 [Anaeramoeba ignava]